MNITEKKFKKYKVEEVVYEYCHTNKETSAVTIMSDNFFLTSTNNSLE